MKTQFQNFNFKTGFSPYWNSFCLVAGAAFLGGLVEPYIGYRSIGFLFLICTLLVGLLGTLRPALFAATISALAWNFFFIPPRFTFHIEQPEDVFLCLAFFVTAAVTGLLATRAKTNDQTIAQRTTHLASIYQSLAWIASPVATLEMLNKIGLTVNQALGGNTGFLLCDANGRLDFSPKPYNALVLSNLDRELAERAYTSGTSAHEDRTLVVALLSSAAKVEGLVVFTSAALSAEAPKFLEALSQPLALVLEKRRTLESSEAANYRKALVSGSPHPSVESSLETTVATQRKLSLTTKAEATPLLEVVTLLLQVSAPMLSHRRVTLDIPAHLPSIQVDKELFAHGLAGVLTDILGVSTSAIRAVARNKKILLLIETDGCTHPTVVAAANPSAEILALQGASLKMEERIEGGTRAIITIPVAEIVAHQPEADFV